MSPKGEKRAGGRPPMDPEGRRESINTRVAPATKRTLQEYARQNKLSVSQALDRVVAALDEVETPKPEPLPASMGFNSVTLRALDKLCERLKLETHEDAVNALIAFLREQGHLDAILEAIAEAS